MNKYSVRVWLNRDDSPSTGSVVAYDGTDKYEEGEYRSSFLKINDCFGSVKLHRAEYDTMEDFISKMKSLRDVVDAFIEHLENNKESPGNHIQKNDKDDRRDIE